MKNSKIFHNKNCYLSTRNLGHYNHFDGTKSYTCFAAKY